MARRYAARFGYRRLGNGTLVPHPEEHRYVRLIVQCYQAGMSAKAIRKMLTKRQCPVPLSAQGIEALLKFLGFYEGDRRS